ncbi:autoinducer binding domain-containing protein [Pseudomonas agarici]|nr:autoinducer binding domain-containing protein [Pseudomonas agarici]NWB90714.1 autoinducer binding domain-containing protein [Pseudomonas agarici]NWC08648.1 autoinducer binding domain-containing protein [Pseudomonas agarici]SEL27291.1 LuxR family transcriptional regulator [Pseudomonas agarici]
MENWQDTQLHQLMSEKEEQAVFNAVFNLAGQIHFSYVSFRVSTLLGGVQPNSSSFNNYPAEWNSCYQRSNYIAIDPLIAHCHSSVFPILWVPETFRNAPAFWRDMQAHGLNHGWSQSVHDVRGIVSILSLARTYEPITSREFYSKTGHILWLCNWLHSYMAEKLISSCQPQSYHPLSPRETEILKWTAEGKTAAEIANILNLTARTVGFHMSTIMRKLGVSNKASAVLRAAKSGLLY